MKASGKSQGVIFICATLLRCLPLLYVALAVPRLLAHQVILGQSDHYSVEFKPVMARK